MGLLWEALLSLMSALGLMLLGGLLFGRLLRPIPGDELWVLIPGRGEGGRLEQQLRGMMWLRGLGLLRCPVAIVDVDMTSAGRSLAMKLISRWSDVVLWPSDHLSELFKSEQNQ